MKKYHKQEHDFTVGLDLSDKKSYYVILDHDGEEVEEGKVPTTTKALQRKFGNVEPMLIALEAGTHSGWVSRLLESLGHAVLIANPRRLRAIYENKNKGDRVDAEYLARIARVDPKLLYPIQHRSEEAQQDLMKLRARHQLVGVRTQLINSVRSMVKLLGERLPQCSAESFPRKAAEHVPESLRATIIPLLASIDDLTERIRSFDREVEQLCQEKYPETGVLRQIKGVGPLTALAFVLTLENPHRFRTSRSVGAYLGLIPKRDQSGDGNPQLRITKQGDSYMRQLLVSSAHYILGHHGEDSDLRRHGEKIAARGGKIAKKKAVVAVARKLSVLMHRLWLTGEVYEPLYNANQREQVA